MKLNKNNYYTIKNKYLSNSRISDYIKDPEYFKMKHIDGTIQFEVTPSIEIGRAVDVYLTESPTAFYMKYSCAVLKKDDPDMFEQNKSGDKIVLTKSQYDKVLSMCHAVERTSAYKYLKNFKTQKILQVDEKIGYFDGLCGIPDFYKIHKDGVCELADLKTSSTIDLNKYHFHCIEFGYYRQLALYTHLIFNNHPEIKKFRYFHLVVENNGDTNRVEVFEFDEKLILDAQLKLWPIINEIKNEKKFKFRDVSFKNPKIIR